MMYGYGYEGWGVLGWVVMGVMMLFFWAGVAALVVFLTHGARNSRENSAPVPSSRDDPERILAQRFARGEIDEAEYHARLDALRRR